MHFKPINIVVSLVPSTICGVRARVEHSTGKVRPKPWMRRGPPPRSGGGGGGGRGFDRGFDEGPYGGAQGGGRSRRRSRKYVRTGVEKLFGSRQQYLTDQIDKKKRSF